MRPEITMDSSIDSPSLPPLAQVSSTLRTTVPRVAALLHVADLVSAFLDVSALITPMRAAASGSVRLFQRVYQLQGGRTDTVTLEDALSHALEAAIKADDLAMATAIHDLHPEPLDVTSLPLAMAHGSLELVQWVIQFRRDRVCCPVRVKTLCRYCVHSAVEKIGGKDAFRIGSWLISQGLITVNEPDAVAGQRTGGLSLAALRALLQSAELARWCDTNGLLNKTKVDTLVRKALRDPNRESLGIVSYFIDRGYAPRDASNFVGAMVKAAFTQEQEDLVELLLSTVCRPLRHHFTYAARSPGGKKLLRWDRDFQQAFQPTYSSAIVNLLSAIESSKNLDDIKFLVEEMKIKIKTVQPTPVDSTEAETLERIAWLHTTYSGEWTNSLDTAAANGHLRVVQWLHENCTEGCTNLAMDFAAANGHLHVVQWLHDHRTEGCSVHAMNKAASNGHLEVVQWLHANHSEGNVSVAMTFAAANGHLAVVKWLAGQNGCPSCVQRMLLATGMAYKTVPSDPRPRVLYALQWLDQHQHEVSVGCAGNCAYDRSIWPTANLAATALGTGDMLLVEYLSVHHPELFAWPTNTRFTLDALLRRGHLPPIKWLYERFPDSLDWQELAGRAQQYRRVATVKWIRTVVSTTA